MQFEAYNNNTVTTSNAKFFCFVTQLPSLVCERKAWLDWFTARDRPTITVPDSVQNSVAIKITGVPAEIKPFRDWVAIHIPNGNYKGKDTFDTEETEPTSEFSVYGVMVSDDNTTVLLFKFTDDATYAPFDMGEQFVLTKGMIPNYTESESTITDVGKFFFNYLLLIDPFDGQPLIPYINERMKPGDIDDKIAKLISEKKVNRKMYNKYMVNGYTFCEDGSIVTGSWSERSLTIDPAVTKRKEELFEKYKGRLDDPVVMVAIEKELVDLDKSTFKGDPAEAFLMTDPGKIFNEQRRKFFIQFGVTASFSKYGGTEFMSNNLSQGARIEDVPIGANEIRRGSYGRGKETAKGGEQTKFLLRIFQNVKLIEDDCHTHRGLRVRVTDYNYKKWVGRYPVDGSTPYTLDDLKSAIGSEIIIRSPMYCNSHGGYCKRCCGKFFEQVDIKAIGMQGLSVTSAMTSIAMKAQHNSSLKGFSIKDITRFITV